MNIKTCKKCRRLFNYVMGPYFCPNCRDEEEKKFQDVKKYIQEHGRCGINEVAEACDVSIKQIQQWLRDDRLTLADDSPMGIECERCGKMIKGGKFCPTCSNEMANKFKNAMGVPQPAAPKKQDPHSSAKMRFLDQ